MREGEPPEDRSPLVPTCCFSCHPRMRWTVPAAERWRRRRHDLRRVQLQRLLYDRRTLCRGHIGGRVRSGRRSLRHLRRPRAVRVTGNRRRRVRGLQRVQLRRLLHERRRLRSGHRRRGVRIRGPALRRVYRLGLLRSPRCRGRDLPLIAQLPLPSGIWWPRPCGPRQLGRGRSPRRGGRSGAGEPSITSCLSAAGEHGPPPASGLRGPRRPLAEGRLRVA